MIEGISGTERLLQSLRGLARTTQGHSCGSAEPACASTSCAHLHTFMCSGQKSFARLWEVASLAIVLYHTAPGSMSESSSPWTHVIHELAGDDLIIDAGVGSPCAVQTKLQAIT